MKTELIFFCPTCKAAPAAPCTSVGLVNERGTVMKSFHKKRRDLVPMKAWPTLSPHTTVLGVGVFNWPRGERVTDRYGSCRTLERETDKVTLEPAHAYLGGRRGRLVAKVLVLHESTHIGDMFRGLSPGGAVLDEEIVLGHGTIFFERDEWGITVGLRPDDGRESNWLDPKALYRAHEQFVRLDFVEDV